MTLTELMNDEPWLVTGALAALAVMLALVAHRIARLLIRRALRNVAMVGHVMASTERASSTLVPLLALQLVWQAAPDTLPFIDSVRHLNAVLLIGAITWLVTAIISGIADGVIARNPVAIDDNLEARRILTQARVLSRSAIVMVVIAGIAMALMTFPGARQFGASLLASAGVIGLVAGIAARPVFSNLIAGLQLALAQPMRIDDVLIVQGEWGRVEEITGTYVVLKIWDERRLIIPLQWFIENPFQNWTRQSSQILGTVFLNLDFSTPIEPLRVELQRLVAKAPEWDHRVAGIQVTDTTDRTMQVRILLSAATAGAAFDLRCKVREAMLAFLARDYPQALPRVRLEQQGEPAGAVRGLGSADGIAGALA
jgi:small-conductance mechanosensitive channel